MIVRNNASIKLKFFLVIMSCFGMTISVIPKQESKESLVLQARRKIAENGLTRSNYIFMMSIPKSGTHLMAKCLELLNVKNIYLNQKFDPSVLFRQVENALKKNQQMAPDYARGMYDVATVGKWPNYLITRMKRSDKKSRLFQCHWPFTKEAEEFFNQCSLANFFVIRDPRDMLISMAYFVHKTPQGMQADVNTLIWDFIDGRKKSFIPWGVGIHPAYPLLYDYGVTDFYKLYLAWMHARKFLMVRFEDLVGPNGGGNLDVQLHTIKKIAKHIGVFLSGKNISGVACNLFGSSPTFREGKIGSWRNHFTQEMIEAYKKVPGASQLLIDLGYEKNNDW